MTVTANSRRIVDAVTGRGEEPPNDLPEITCTWSSNARPDRDAPGAVYAARLLARTVDHLSVAAGVNHDMSVPAASDRIRILLEAAGLTPGQVAKYGQEIDRELHLLVANCDEHSRQVLHRRMGVDLAATLVPQLDGGTT